MITIPSIPATAPITYHGVTAHQIEFYYGTPSGNCTGKKEYKTVIVLTPDIIK
jgi:hypothetical protein